MIISSESAKQSPLCRPLLDVLDDELSRFWRLARHVEFDEHDNPTRRIYPEQQISQVPAYPDDSKKMLDRLFTCDCKRTKHKKGCWASKLKGLRTRKRRYNFARLIDALGVDHCLRLLEDIGADKYRTLARYREFKDQHAWAHLAKLKANRVAALMNAQKPVRVPLDYHWTSDRYGGRGSGLSAKAMKVVLKAGEGVGLIGYEKGERLKNWDADNVMNRQTNAWLTEEGIRLFLEVRGMWLKDMVPNYGELVILREEKKKPKHYVDNEFTNAWRQWLLWWNSLTPQARHSKTGDPVDNTVFVPFNGDFEHGGRIYYLGTSPQSWDKEDQNRLYTVVWFEARERSVEVDLVNSHPVMAHVELGLPIPEGDLYDRIPGSWTRKQKKRALNAMLNASSYQQAYGWIRANLVKTGDPDADRDEEFLSDGARALMRAVKHTYPKLAFYTRAGLRYQKIEGEVMKRVLTEFHKSWGIKLICIHDSVLGPESLANLLEQAVREALDHQGLQYLQTETETTHNPPQPTTPPVCNTVFLCSQVSP
jgi:hypothetical protein